MIILISMHSLEQKQEVQQCKDPRFEVVIILNRHRTVVDMVAVVVFTQPVTLIALVFTAGLVVVVFLPMVNRVYQATLVVYLT